MKYNSNTGKHSNFIVRPTGGERITPNDSYFHYLGISLSVQETIRNATLNTSILYEITCYLWARELRYCYHTGQVISSHYVLVLVFNSIYSSTHETQLICTTSYKIHLSENIIILESFYNFICFINRNLYFHPMHKGGQEFAVTPVK